jgi:phosphatidylglycerophosphate synthase
LDTHGAPNIISIRIFLTLIYLLAKLLMIFRFTPNAVTILGGIVGLSAVWFVYNEIWIAAALVCMFSSFFDGVDGAIAEITNKKSKFGAVLDSTIDRLVEIGWFLSLIWVGAQPLSVIALIFAIMAMEYSRAKANALGVTGPGAITPAERPTRAIMFFMLNISFTIVETRDQVATIGILVLFGLTVGSIIHLFFRFANKLRNNAS